MLAHATGLKLGEMHYNIVDVHIYKEHLDQVNEMLERRDLALPAPKLWLNPEIDDFYKFDNSKELNDIKLIDYQCPLNIPFWYIFFFMFSKFLHIPIFEI